MSNLNERIAQWEKMTREAPDDMSWYSLALAYREAGRFEEADKALAKVLELNPAMSKAYQMRGEVLVRLGHHDLAVEVATAGYIKAAERGEAMLQRSLETLLQRLGQPVPKVAAPAAPAVDPNDPNAILDKRTGRPGTRLPDAPMRGPVGKYILKHFSQQTWREWIGQGTKVINELRLDFSRPDHQKVYEQHMMEWLGITAEDIEREEAK